MQAEPFRRFVDMVRCNSHEFEAQGRVLRLKQYISADVRPAAINAILEALAVNTLVEVLYIQNFEQVQKCTTCAGVMSRCCMHCNCDACMMWCSSMHASTMHNHRYYAHHQPHWFD